LQPHKKKTQKNPKLLFQKANLYLKKFYYDKAIEFYILKKATERAIANERTEILPFDL